MFLIFETVLFLFLFYYLSTKGNRTKFYRKKTLIFFMKFID